MREKELTLSILIHHISTFIGLIISIYYLVRNHINPPVESAACSFFRVLWQLKKCSLILFTALQSWAGFKILKDFADGTSRLRKSYQDIHRLSRSKKEERRILWEMTFLSSIFKIGLPHLLA